MVIGTARETPQLPQLPLRSARSNRGRGGRRAVRDGETVEPRLSLMVSRSLIRDATGRKGGVYGENPQSAGRFWFKTRDAAAASCAISMRLLYGLFRRTIPFPHPRWHAAPRLRRGGSRPCAPRTRGPRRDGRRWL